MIFNLNEKPGTINSGFSLCTLAHSCSSLILGCCGRQNRTGHLAYEASVLTVTLPRNLRI